LREPEYCTLVQGWTRLEARKNSPSALFFLATFALPRNPEEYPLLSQTQWAHLLGLDPQTFTAELLHAGLLETAPLGAQLHIRLSRDDLKRFCQDRRLPTSGSKRDLVLRLVAHDPVGVNSQLRAFNLKPNVRSLATEARQGIVGNAAFMVASELLLKAWQASIHHFATTAFCQFRAELPRGGTIRIRT
jgi:hypothetical protein